MALLDVTDLSTHFFTREGVVRAVDGVSFSVERGRTLGIVGESGCGKSVTALSIMGLIPRPPAKIVAGSVMFDGQDLTKLPEKRLEDLAAVVALDGIDDEPDSVVLGFLAPAIIAGEYGDALPRHVDVPQDQRQRALTD